MNHLAVSEPVQDGYNDAKLSSARAKVRLGISQFLRPYTYTLFDAFCNLSVG